MMETWQETLARLIGQLPEPQRTLLLRRMGFQGDGITLSEVAEELGIPLKSAVRYFRCIERPLIKEIQRIHPDFQLPPPRD